MVGMMFMLCRRDKKIFSGQEGCHIDLSSLPFGELTDVWRKASVLHYVEVPFCFIYNLHNCTL